RELEKRKITYVPSEANFILVEVGDGAYAASALLKKGIIVRNMSVYDLPDFIRVTIGTESANKKFIEELDKLRS
ncbi:unnamed protein product, partial [marine sediment metagenome]